MNDNAKCSKCNADIKWHWDQDTFFINGSLCKSEEISGTIKIELFYCKCGKLLGAQSNSNGEVLSIDEFKHIDWELECNLMETNRICNKEKK